MDSETIVRRLIQTLYKTVQIHPPVWSQSASSNHSIIQILE